MAEFLLTIIKCLLMQAFSLIFGIYLAYVLETGRLYQKFGKRYLFSNDKIYRMKGLRLFKALYRRSPLSLWDYRITYGAGPKRIKLREAGFLHFKREVEHFLSFAIMCMFILGSLFTENLFPSPFILILSNLLFNFIPFLYHQSVRKRIHGMIGTENGTC